jgi:hypothetical protein
MLPNEWLQAGTADLFLTLEHELYVDGQAALRGKKRLRGLDRLENRAFVVRYAARVQAAGTDRRHERRTDPFVQWIGGLHIIVPVDQHRWLARCTQPLCEDDGMAACGHDLHIERAGSRDLCRQPSRGPFDIRAMPRVGADAGNGGELDQI